MVNSLDNSRRYPHAVYPIYWIRRQIYDTGAALRPIGTTRRGIPIRLHWRKELNQILGDVVMLFIFCSSGQDVLPVDSFGSASLSDRIYGRGPDPEQLGDGAATSAQPFYPDISDARAPASHGPAAARAGDLRETYPLGLADGVHQACPGQLGDEARGGGIALYFLPEGFHKVTPAQNPLIGGIPFAALP